MKIEQAKLDKIKELTGYDFDDLIVKPQFDFLKITWGLFNDKRINKAQYDWLNKIKEDDMPKITESEDMLEMIQVHFPDAEVVEEPKQIPLVIKDKLTIRERILVIMSRHTDFVMKHALQDELKGYEMHSEETFARCMRKLAEDGILESKMVNGLVAYKLK